MNQKQQQKNQKDKKKLCWNCEGSASFQDENCPYCGVYLSPIAINGGNGKEQELSPPYKLDKNEKKEIPSSPYHQKKNKQNKEPEAVQEEESTSPGQVSVNSIAITITMLLAGIVFLLFGVALVLFSHHGFLTLRWNGDYWFVYLLLALPMLFFGWRSLEQLRD